MDPIAKHWPEIYISVQKYLINYRLCKFLLLQVNYRITMTFLTYSSNDPILKILQLYVCLVNYTQKLSKEESSVNAYSPQNYVN